MPLQSLTQLGWTNFFQAQLDPDSQQSALPYRVVAVQRNLIECLGFDQQGQSDTLQLSTYFWRDEPPEGHPTVGDWLLVDQQGQPLRLLQRNTLIKRRSASRESLLQLIAANIDTVFIVTSCNDEFNLNRIERYLALAAETGIYSVVVLTKTDLCEDTSPYTEALLKNHPLLPVEQVNATDPASLDVISNWIRPGQTVALLGSSGVGKSTIINSLSGMHTQQTGSIRESDSKGRHTTTARSLHLLPGGGLLLDSPGMRELQMVDAEEGIRSTFADIEALAASCRFDDCQHGSEPGCAVQQAIEEGTLEARRLENFHKLLAEQQRNNETLAQRRQHDKALGRFYKHTLKATRHLKSRD